MALRRSRTAGQTRRRRFTPLRGRRPRWGAVVAAKMTNAARYRMMAMPADTAPARYRDPRRIGTGGRSASLGEAVSFSPPSAQCMGAMPGDRQRVRRPEITDRPALVTPLQTEG